MRSRTSGGAARRIFRLGAAMLLAGGLCLGGCSRYALDEAAYNALQSRECLQQTGMPGCAGQQGFEDYRRDRRSTLGRVR